MVNLIINLTDLPKTDKFGHCDPYVKIYINNELLHQTDHVKNTAIAKFDENKEGEKLSISNNFIENDAEIKFVVMDDDFFADDFVGQFIITMKELCKAVRLRRAEFNLLGENGTNSKKFGKIKINFDEELYYFKIFLHDIPKTDNLGLSYPDIYFKLNKKPKYGLNETVYTSEIIKHKANVDFHTFSISISSAELNDFLEIQFYDKETFGSSDELGSFLFSFMKISDEIESISEIPCIKANLRTKKKDKLLGNLTILLVDREQLISDQREKEGHFSIVLKEEAIEADQKIYFSWVVDVYPGGFYIEQSSLGKFFKNLSGSDNKPSEMVIELAENCLILRKSKTEPGNIKDRVRYVILFDKTFTVTRISKKIIFNNLDRKVICYADNESEAKKIEKEVVKKFNDNFGVKIKDGKFPSERYDADGKKKESKIDGLQTNSVRLPTKSMGALGSKLRTFSASVSSPTQERDFSKQFITTNSFAPERPNSPSRWFVQGRDYYWYLHDCLKRAQKEIYISAWWLIPEVDLKRPIEKYGDKSSLKQILLEKAAQGVKIYILLFGSWMTNIILRNGANRTEKIFNDLANIQVMKFGSGRRNLFLYSNHDKFVVVDQCVALVGGIDICYDRWDDERYLLLDDKVKNISKGKAFGASSEKILQTKSSSSISDSAEPEKSDTMVHGEKGLLWRGKDYNHISKFILGFDDWFKDQLNRTKEHRSPWQDIHSMVYGQAAYDIARHFIERWNFTLIKKNADDEDEDSNNYSALRFLVPAARSEIDGRVAPFLNIESESGRNFCNQAQNIKCQALRSMGPWSGGINKIEKSVQEAYIEAIQNSKKYIYIENQYFITSFEDMDVESGAGAGENVQSEVKNTVGQAIIERIVRAHNEKTDFKCYIVLPLMPDTGGDIYKFDSDLELQAIMHYNYASLVKDNPKKHGSSIFQALKLKGIKATDYIHVGTLRSYHQVTEKKSITEQIYVHSKVLLVDDEIAIIGSANLNDRSLTGDRDSEVCLKFTDIPSQGTNFCRSLRLKLWNVFLGRDVSNKNPESLEMFQFWKHTAKTNADIFEKVFKFAPNDKIKDYEKLKKYGKERVAKLAEMKPEESRKELEKVNGVLVNWPTKFLINEWFHPGSAKIFGVPAGRAYEMISSKGPVT